MTGTKLNIFHTKFRVPEGTKFIKSIVSMNVPTTAVVGTDVSVNPFVHLGTVPTHVRYLQL